MTNVPPTFPPSGFVIVPPSDAPSLAACASLVPPSATFVPGVADDEEEEHAIIAIATKLTAKIAHNCPMAMAGRRCWKGPLLRMRCLITAQRERLSRNRQTFRRNLQRAHRNEKIDRVGSW